MFGIVHGLAPTDSVVTQKGNDACYYFYFHQPKSALSVAPDNFYVYQMVVGGNRGPANNYSLRKINSEPCFTENWNLAMRSITAKVAIENPDQFMLT